MRTRSIIERSSVDVARKDEHEDCSAAILSTSAKAFTFIKTGNGFSISELIDKEISDVVIPAKYNNAIAGVANIPEIISLERSDGTIRDIVSFIIPICNNKERQARAHDPANPFFFRLGSSSASNQPFLLVYGCNLRSKTACFSELVRKDQTQSESSIRNKLSGKERNFLILSGVVKYTL